MVEFRYPLSSTKQLRTPAQKHMRLLKNYFGPSKAPIGERRISNLESQAAPDREPGGAFSTVSYESVEKLGSKQIYLR